MIVAGFLEKPVVEPLQEQVVEPLDEQVVELLEAQVVELLEEQVVEPGYLEEQAVDPLVAPLGVSVLFSGPRLPNNCFPPLLSEMFLLESPLLPSVWSPPFSPLAEENLPQSPASLPPVSPLKCDPY